MRINRKFWTLGIEPRYGVPLMLVYLIAHAGTFGILHAIFWDDWTLVGQSPHTLITTFTMDGSVFAWIGYLHIALLSVGLWSYRVLTFFLMYFSGVLLWKILERNPWIDIETRFAIVVLFLALPLDWARDAIIDFPYVLCYFSFFLGWYLIGRSRWLALLFFLFSFNTNSILVFYALPIADWYLRDNDTVSLSRLLRWGSRKLDFLALPFVYWAVKQIYFRPFGLYAGYNEHFSLRKLIATPRLMISDLLHLQVDVLLFVCLAAACMFILPVFTGSQRPINRRRMLVSGCVALACALFPYWVLGLVPTFFHWESRHQLLMPLGASLLCAWGFSYLKPDYRYMGLAVVLGASLAIDVQVYHELSQDWRKQQEIISLLSHNNAVRNANLVVFTDMTQSARGRTIGFYEWNAFLRRAYGNELRFAVRPEQLDAYARGEFDRNFVAEYDAEEHKRSADEKRVCVTVDYRDLSNFADEEYQWPTSFGRRLHYQLRVGSTACPSTEAAQMAALP